MRSGTIIAVAFAAALSGACGAPDGSHGWPSKPVRVVVPFGAGSGSDAVVRLLAPRLSERWRQPVIVDNRPGGDGIVGVQAFLSAKDQHTLLFTPSGQVTLNPLLHDPPPYDAARDLMPIAAAIDPAIGIAVTDDLLVRSLSDLVALAQRRPDAYVWAAVPGLPEVLFRAFLEVERIQVRHAAYRDMSTAVQDLNAGRLHVMVASVATLSPSLRTGSGRLLAVTNRARISAHPNVPTAIEAGYPLLAVDGKWGFFGWRDMPIELRDRIAADVRHALNDHEMASRVAAMGLTAAPGTAADFAGALDRQREQIARIVNIVGIGRGGNSSGR